MEALEHGAEVLHDVLRPIVVLVGGKAPVDVAAGLEAAVERVDGARRIDEVLEDVHGGDEVEARRRQRHLLEIEEGRRPAARREALLAEGEQDAADVRQGDVEAVVWKSSAPEPTPEPKSR